MKILGVDPGTARLGWGVINDQSNQQTVGDYDCIETKKTILSTDDTRSDAARLKDLYDQFIKVIKTHKPDAVAVEDLFFFKNKTTVIKVSQARGVILLAAETLKIPSFSYSPTQIKMAVTGYGRADKHQVQQMTTSILKLESIPKLDDTADALAVALTHAFTHKIKTLLAK